MTSDEEITFLLRTIEELGKELLYENSFFYDFPKRYAPPHTPDKKELAHLLQKTDSTHHNFLLRVMRLMVNKPSKKAELKVLFSALLRLIATLEHDAQYTILAQRTSDHWSSLELIAQCHPELMPSMLTALSSMTNEELSHLLNHSSPAHWNALMIVFRYSKDTLPTLLSMLNQLPQTTIAQVMNHFQNLSPTLFNQFLAHASQDKETKDAVHRMKLITALVNEKIFFANPSSLDLLINLQNDEPLSAAILNEWTQDRNALKKVASLSLDQQSNFGEQILERMKKENESAFEMLKSMDSERRKNTLLTIIDLLSSLPQEKRDAWLNDDWIKTLFDSQNEWVDEFKDLLVEQLQPEDEALFKTSLDLLCLYSPASIPTHIQEQLEIAHILNGIKSANYFHGSQDHSFFQLLKTNYEPPHTPDKKSLADLLKSTNRQGKSLLMEILHKETQNPSEKEAIQIFVKNLISLITTLDKKTQEEIFSQKENHNWSVFDLAARYQPDLIVDMLSATSALFTNETLALMFNHSLKGDWNTLMIALRYCAASTNEQFLKIIHNFPKAQQNHIFLLSDDQHRNALGLAFQFSKETLPTILTMLAELPQETIANQMNAFQKNDAQLFNTFITETSHHKDLKETLYRLRLITSLVNHKIHFKNDTTSMNLLMSLQKDEPICTSLLEQWAEDTIAWKQVALMKEPAHFAEQILERLEKENEIVLEMFHHENPEVRKNTQSTILNLLASLPKDIRDKSLNDGWIKNLFTSQNEWMEERKEELLKGLSSEDTSLFETSLALLSLYYPESIPADIQEERAVADILHDIQEVAKNYPNVEITSFMQRLQKPYYPPHTPSPKELFDLLANFYILSKHDVVKPILKLLERFDEENQITLLLFALQNSNLSTSLFLQYILENLSKEAQSKVLSSSSIIIKIVNSQPALLKQIFNIIQNFSLNQQKEILLLTEVQHAAMRLETPEFLSIMCAHSTDFIYAAMKDVLLDSRYSTFYTKTPTTKLERSLLELAILIEQFENEQIVTAFQKRRAYLLPHIHNLREFYEQSLNIHSKHQDNQSMWSICLQHAKEVFKGDSELLKRITIIEESVQGIARQQRNQSRFEQFKQTIKNLNHSSGAALLLEQDLTNLAINQQVALVKQVDSNGSNLLLHVFLNAQDALEDLFLLIDTFDEKDQKSIFKTVRENLSDTQLEQFNAALEAAKLDGLTHQMTNLQTVTPSAPPAEPIYHQAYEIDPSMIAALENEFDRPIYTTAEPVGHSATPMAYAQLDELEKEDLTKELPVQTVEDVLTLLKNNLQNGNSNYTLQQLQMIRKSPIITQWEFIQALQSPQEKIFAKKLATYLRQNPIDKREFHLIELGAKAHALSQKAGWEIPGNNAQKLQQMLSDIADLEQKNSQDYDKRVEGWRLWHETINHFKPKFKKEHQMSSILNRLEQIVAHVKQFFFKSQDNDLFTELAQSLRKPVREKAPKVQQKTTETLGDMVLLQAILKPNSDLLPKLVKKVLGLDEVERHRILKECNKKQQRLVGSRPIDLAVQGDLTARKSLYILEVERIMLDFAEGKDKGVCSTFKALSIALNQLEDNDIQGWNQAINGAQAKLKTQIGFISSFGKTGYGIGFFKPSFDSLLNEMIIAGNPNAHFTR